MAGVNREMAFSGVAPGAEHLVRRVAFEVVVGCWCLFALVFALRKRTPRSQVSKRDRTAIFGMVLESAGYVVVWSQSLPRKLFAPVPSGSQAAEWGLAVLAVAIAAASVWIVNAAVHSLGKQWAVSARLVEGHALIQDGPYRFVRNPIYLGMFGMLLATGLVTTQWIPLLAASLLFIGGTYVRIRSEERLLRGAFGSEFEAYARNVPALLPGIY